MRLDRKTLRFKSYIEYLQSSKRYLDAKRLLDWGHDGIMYYVVILPLRAR